MEHEHNTEVSVAPKKSLPHLSPKMILGAFAVIIVAAGAYVGYQKIVPQYPPLLPEALREGRIGTVAVVNGEKISRERYNSALAAVTNMALQNGVNIADNTILLEVRKAALKTVVENEILLQTARAANIAVDEAKVNEQILATEIQIGGKEIMKEELAKMGITEKMYRASVTDQTLLALYIEQAVPTSTIAISDDEVKAFYNERVGAIADKSSVPKLADAKEEIRAYLVNNKHQELVTAHVAELVAKATVEEKITFTEATTTEATTTEEVKEEAATETNAQ